MAADHTVPGLDLDAARRVATTLQGRLYALVDLHLTLKHVHWNVVGPNFIAVHEMLDTQVKGVRAMSDTAAERIATLGGAPDGRPGALVAGRSWDDYDIGRATTQQHLAALDLVYRGVIGDHREAVAAFEDLDLVSQDLLINQLRDLELYQWFVRAHLESPDGELTTQGVRTEREAAEAAARH